MLVTRIPTRAEGNPRWPLPADYETLASEGQRLARVAALRQWMIKDQSRQQKANAFSASVNLFDALYLMPRFNKGGEIVSDPLFYKTWIQPPPFHDIIFASSILHRRSVGVGPRGGAKSFAHAKKMMTRLVVEPRYEVLYGTATNDLSEAMGDRCKYQLYFNSRIQDDWAPEYGGPLKPSKSEGLMGMQGFTLRNRAAMFSTSAQSRQRGRRPTEYLLDDPEYDPSATTSMQERRSFMEWLIFRVAMPMVQLPGACITWWGTFVSPLHYLWHATHTKELSVDGVVKHVALDRRFDKWFRIIIPAEMDAADGSTASFWPHAYPKDEAEKKALGCDDDTQTLRDIEESMGSEAYNSEMRHKPGGRRGTHFPLLSRERHGYWFEQVDALISTDPLNSSAVIAWNKVTPGGLQIERMTLRDFCSRFRRFITLDSSWTDSPSSDWKVAACMAINDQNDLLVMDLWGAQCKQPKLEDVSLLMAQKWHASLHPELVDAGIDLEQALISKVRSKIESVQADDGSVQKLSWFPYVKGFQPGFTSKEARINAALTWRFQYGKIKFNWDMIDIAPWTYLKDQVEQWNPALEGGGLDHDDFLDDVGAYCRVPGTGSRGEAPPENKKKEFSHSAAVQKLKDGESVDENGVSLFQLVWPNLTKVEADEIMAARAAREPGGSPESFAAQI